MLEVGWFVTPLRFVILEVFDRLKRKNDAAGVAKQAAIFKELGRTRKKFSKRICSSENF
jgi:hypothetical protein